MSLKKVILSVVVLALILVGVGISQASANSTPPPLRANIGFRTKFDRVWNWDIVKSAEQSALLLSPGQTFPVNYAVNVNGSPTDSNWLMRGDVHFYNESGVDQIVNSFSVVITPDNFVVPLACPVTFPVVVPTGTSLGCTFNLAFADGSTRVNTFTATLADGSQYTDAENIIFATPYMETDECINVEDSLFGFLGTVCGGTGSFTYTIPVGPFLACGTYQVPNIASFVTQDTGATGSSQWIVDVTVPCAGGCSLTPGYWKTHSAYGPAPYDETWAQVGEDTVFFLSQKSWYNVLWTTPQGGNAYYILAHAYIAARLNKLNGADTSAINAELANATSLFNVYTPNANLSRTVRQEFLRIATILDNYNNGLIGPGHCSE